MSMASSVDDAKATSVVLQGVELHSPWLLDMAVRVGLSSLSDMPSVSMASSVDFAKASSQSSEYLILNLRAVNDRCIAGKLHSRVIATRLR